MEDLLPYLAGAAAAFVVQFLIQVYVVPLVETRKRRLERWEKDVLDLGELLSGGVSDAARQAMSDQFAARSTEKMVANPEFDQATVEGYRRKCLVDAREATRTFNDQVSSRAEWLMDRISMYRSSDRVVKFTQASMRYRLYMLKRVHSRGPGATRRHMPVVELLVQVEHACGSCPMSPVRPASGRWCCGCGL